VSGELLIRADADEQIGIGHVMRCLALARAWPSGGGGVTFVTRCPAEGLRERIRKAGIKLVAIDRSHPNPADLATTLDVLSRIRSRTGRAMPTWAAIDGYHFDPIYHEAIRQTAGRLLAVDDGVRLGSHCAHVLLNQNLGAERLEYPHDADAALLLGSRYALLREEFRSWRTLRRRTPQLARKILVTFGGADPDNATETVLAALAQIDVSTPDAELHVKVVVGAANSHRDALHERVRSLRETSTAMKTDIFTDVDDMPELMAWADLAVAAAGSTCWEMALMQLPAAVVVLADNQQQIADRLAEAGAVLNLGRADRLAVEDAARAIADLCRDRVARASQSEAGLRLLDGRGAERVTAVMRALDEPFPAGQPALRPADADDAISLWRQTNHPSTRRASIRSSDPIPLPEHVRWLHGRLESPDACLWVLDFHGLLLGSVRYERSEAAAVISVNVLPAFWRRGLAARMILETAAAACKRFGVKRVRARVRQDNPASIAMFGRLGFDTIESGAIHGLSCNVFEQDAKSITKSEPPDSPPRD